ncbi:MAG TPA: hypothetical protein PKG54_16370 [Phycisphaerae bacterium]|nr:hypothetical protein [Phycisphaerae bacterium]HQA45139.1 hypothetical protein [Phycisphaerae bacterium]HXK87798.1 hypothetical protein [Phycisphaerae bacterium]
MSGFFDSAYKGLGYLLSLPERTLRSLAAVTGGTTSLLTETLFPEMLRDTTLYKIFLGDAQRFLVEKIAQVQRQGGEAAPAAEGDAGQEDYVQRKVAGTALEAAGLLAMHLSPLWVFAIAADAAAGSNEFLQRLVVQLKRNNVLPPDAEIAGLHELLAAIQEASRRSAAAVDTPPLSREEVSQLADEMTEKYGRMFASVSNLLPRFETVWKRMESLAGRENISLERLGGILTMDVAEWSKKGFGAMLAVGQTGADLFGERVLASYERTLDAVAQDGVAGYLSRHMKPFLQAAMDAFSPARQTWIESWLGKLQPAPTEPPTASTGKQTPPGEADAASPPQG